MATANSMAKRATPSRSTVWIATAPFSSGRTLMSSGPAAPANGTNLAGLRTPWQERRFYWKDDRLYQRSMLDKGKEWEVVQVRDTITPGNPHYSEKSRLAKTIQQDGQTWGDAARR